MKHQLAADLDDLFRETLQQLGLELAQPERAWLLGYLDSVLEANAQVNLTRITKPTEAIRLHLVDSLSAKGELDLAPAGPALDLGSGAGFPGVPLAVASGREFTLLDSVAKKGSAVSAVLAQQGSQRCEITVASGRAEELARRQPARFSAVVARAVAPLPSLVELSSPLLAPGGLLIALKGRPDSSERQSGSEAARLVGMREASWREFELPEGDEARTIVTYEKVAVPKVALPRRTGLAQHNPLA